MGNLSFEHQENDAVHLSLHANRHYLRWTGAQNTRILACP
jgi:hypothetical protein